MFKKVTLAGAAFAMGAAALVPAAPAAAQDYGYDRYGQHAGYYDGYRDNRRVYRGNNRRYNAYRAREKCRDGDGGTIVGAIAGGLIGNSVAGRGGDRTLGTILGGAVGALAGREIDRSDRPGYCRR